MEHVADKEEIQQVEAIQKDLREKEESLEGVESLNQTLIVTERMSNEELQEARKELINVCTGSYNSDSVPVTFPVFCLFFSHS